MSDSRKAQALATSSGSSSRPISMAVARLQGAPIPLHRVLAIYPLVWTISFGVVTFSFLLGDARRAGGVLNPTAVIDRDPLAAFRERLPFRLREAELWALRSENHYLRVITNKGEELILMRLGDAERELSKADGLRTHRSWWVARAGVTSIHRDKGRLALKLKNGDIAPVSRTYRDAVLRGWNA